MSANNIDEVVNYLSTKFNRIFCDREFVSCVNEDFQTLLNDKNKCCVLVFPALEPIYLKAVRYQAKITDLAVFGVSAGKYKSIAVCHKDLLKKPQPEVKEETMSECCSSSSRRKRPERQLYVPPAQRRSHRRKENSPPQNLDDNSLNKKTASKVINNNEKVTTKTTNLESKYEEPRRLIALNDIIDCLQCYNITSLKWSYEIPIFLEPSSTIFSTKIEFYNHYDCEFKKYIIYKKFMDKNFTIWSDFVPVYIYKNKLERFQFLSSYFVCWQPDLNKLVNYSIKENSNQSSVVYPVFNFNIEPAESDLNRFIKNSVLIVDHHNHSFEELMVDFDNQTSELNLIKINCDMCNCDCENYPIVDLSVFDLGHYCLIENSSSKEIVLHQCIEHHEATECYLNKLQLEAKHSEMSKARDTSIKEDTNTIHSQEVETNGETTVIRDNNNKNIANSNDLSSLNNKDLFKNSINGTKGKRSSEMKTSSKKNEHEEEKEIMRKTKENINRKSRPIMKYVDDPNDTLRIGKNDNINNWEDLFDDEGQIQEELFTEIAQKVGNEVTIVKATEDYTAYAAKPIEELEHVVELYNFPASLETHDIIQMFSQIKSDAMYIKWVDDTHALLVLGSLSQAQRAVEMENPLIKVRPMTAASGISLAVAHKSDLKPAMKRPQTNLQTARRLITTHLGTKSRVSKEQSAKEKEDLQAARAMKRQTKQNEKDAWEGKLKSVVR